MSSPSESTELPDGVRPAEIPLSGWLPDWMVRSGWLFDIGFQRMENRELAGWMPAAGIFSSLALLLMVGLSLRIPLALPLGIVGALDLLATRHFVGIGCRRLRRLGFRGPTRGRWWFEVAALAWTLLMSCACLVAVHHRAALQGGWQQGMVEFAFTCAKCLGPAFLGLAITGYFLGLLRGIRIRGRSMELVNFFFWMIVGVGFLMWAVPQVPGWFAAAVGLVGIVVACLATLLEIHRRSQTSRANAGGLGAKGNGGG
ncbi:MAG TPA: hypothetical protein VHB77_05995 [Planctomycetaceae bacterium]|nr:hypothetical protein [Planctomycetaceae bacterium]